MTLEEIANMLTSIQGFADKVTYYAWPENDSLHPPPPLPFICYWETGSDNYNADGIAYYPVKQIDIELYSRFKDPVSEAAIEAALTTEGLIYDKSCDYIESESCYMTTYEIEV